MRKIIIIFFMVLLVVFGSSLSVNVSGDNGLIPQWIKNTAKFWANNQINDIEFLDSLQWLIDNDILEIPKPREIQTTLQQDNPIKVAGWRSSEYGDENLWGHDQTDPDYWINVAKKMSTKFPNHSPGGILVIGQFDGQPGTSTFSYLPFPKPTGNFPNVTFGNNDEIESLLNVYDLAGLKLYLQVEPADADVPMLMDLVMQRYQHHSSVIGFGVDVEWYHQKDYPDGRPINDDELNAWAKQVEAYNPNYSLMVKHWDWSYLSNARPDNVLFLTDTQDIDSLSDATNEYIAWIDHFGSSQVGFQIGYPSDLQWWGELKDPAVSIINPIIAARPNANIGAIFWVDFSVIKAFPVETTRNSEVIGNEISHQRI